MAWSIFQQGGGPEVAVGWAEQLLRLIGAPVTPGNVQFVYQWEKSEQGGGKYNPLNQGPDTPAHPNYTSTGSQYGGGAADYVTWEAGLLGARDFLNMPAYAGVRNALLADKPAEARSALIRSPWASSHYYWGAGWSNATVPGGHAVLPPVTGASLTALEVTGQTGSPDTCQWGFNADPFTSLPLVGGLFPQAQRCLLAKSQVRAVAGAGIMAGALIIGIAGMAFVFGVSVRAIPGAGAFARQFSGYNRAVRQDETRRGASGRQPRERQQEGS